MMRAGFRGQKEELGHLKSSAACPPEKKRGSSILAEGVRDAAPEEGRK